MSFRFSFPRLQAFDANGDPLAGGKLHFYTTGTTTPEDTFSDAALTTANTNPVVADSAGRFGDIYLSDETYKVILKDSADVTIWTADPVTRSLAASAFMQTVLDDANAAAARATLGAGTADYRNKGTDITSGATLTLPASLASEYFTVTGTTTVTAISARPAGSEIELVFADALTFTHSGTDLILPGAASITTAAGDVARLTNIDGTAKWKCTNYTRANGQPVVAPTVHYESAELTITSGGTHTLTHGLGGFPRGVFVWLKCVTGEGGYTAGQEVLIQAGENSDNTQARGLSLIATTTQLILRIGSDSNSFLIIDASAGNRLSIANANWRLIIRAFR